MAPVGREGLYRLIGIIEDSADTSITDLTRHLPAPPGRSISAAPGPGSRPRPSDHEGPSCECPEQTPCDHPGDRTAGRIGPGCFDRRRVGLQIRAKSRCLSRSGSKQSSSGGKERLGGISKRGDGYLRWLLVAGAMAVVRYAKRHGTRRPWLVQLLARRPAKTAIVALANKMARVAWALMISKEVYREPSLKAA